VRQGPRRPHRFLVSCLHSKAGGAPRVQQPQPAIPSSQAYCSWDWLDCGGTRYPPLKGPIRAAVGGRRGDSESANTSHIATGLAKARDQAKLYRVGAYYENDRNRCGCGFGGWRHRCATGGHDHIHPTLNQIGSHDSKSIVLIPCPTVFDRHVPALDIACFGQALVKCSNHFMPGVWRRGIEKPDHRHRSRLRQRYDRPSRRAPSGRRLMMIVTSRISFGSAGPMSLEVFHCVVSLRSRAERMDCLASASWLSPFKFVLKQLLIVKILGLAPNSGRR
jgi:hypothetical protein